MVDPSGSIMSLNRLEQHNGLEALVSLSEDGSMKFWVSELSNDDSLFELKELTSKEQILESKKKSLKFSYSIDLEYD